MSIRMYVCKRFRVFYLIWSYHFPYEKFILCCPLTPLLDILYIPRILHMYICMFFFWTYFAMGGKTQSQSGFIQGCQMLYFQTKNLKLGKFWSVLDWKLLIYFMSICNILRTFWIFYDHLAHFVFIWYIFLFFLLCNKKNLATLVSSNRCLCLLKFSWRHVYLTEFLKRNL
jgi:hypothetical protein